MSEQINLDDIPETKHDYTPATKGDVDLMITESLMMFHDALVERGQIFPIPGGESDWDPISRDQLLPKKDQSDPS